LSYFIFFYNKKARLTGNSPDCREHALLNHVLQTAERGNAESVLRAIVNFTSHTWLPILGEEKGSILDAAVQGFNPKVALEIGTYCGYSAIRIASKMTKPGSKLISVEMNSENCAIARAIIEHAGLSSKVTVFKGTLNKVVDELAILLSKTKAPQFDFIFMDHFKNCYLPDFLLLKKKNVLRKGTGIVADSIGFPEAQDYSKYLKEHPEELKTEEYKSDVKFLNWLPCKLTVSTYEPEGDDALICELIELVV
jgi:catechol O-methyltransferase